MTSATHANERTESIKRVRKWGEKAKRAAVSAALTADPEHPQSYLGMSAARSVLGEDVATGTLHSWLVLYRDEVTALLPQTTTALESVIAGRDSTLKKMDTVRQKTLDRLMMDDKLDASSARDLAVIFGIQNDHIRKDTSIPVEMEQVLRQFVADCSILNMDPIAVLQAFGKTVHDKASLPPGNDAPMIDAALSPLEK